MIFDLSILKRKKNVESQGKNAFYNGNDLENFKKDVMQMSRHVHSGYTTLKNNLCTVQLKLPPYIPL